MTNESSGCPLCTIVSSANDNERPQNNINETSSSSSSPNVLYHDDKITIIPANAPVSSQHVIIIVNAHIRNIQELSLDDISLLEHIHEKAKEICNNDNLKIGVISSPFSDPQMPVKTHLHVHAFPSIDTKKFGWLRSWVFSDLIFYKLTDLIAEIRESVTNNRIKS